MASCMELGFVCNNEGNLPVAIQKRHLHYGYEARIDQGTGSVRLRMFQRNERSVVLPKCLKKNLFIYLD